MVLGVREEKIRVIWQWKNINDEVMCSSMCNKIEFKALQKRIQRKRTSAKKAQSSSASTHYKIPFQEFQYKRDSFRFAVKSAVVLMVLRRVCWKMEKWFIARVNPAANEFVPNFVPVAVPFLACLQTLDARMETWRGGRHVIRHSNASEGELSRDGTVNVWMNKVNKASTKLLMAISWGLVCLTTV